MRHSHGSVPRWFALVVGALLAGSLALVGTAPPAGATPVGTEAAFRSAWSNAGTTSIELTANINLTCTGGPTPLRTSATPIEVDGQDHLLQNTCNDGTDQGVLRSNGTGDVELVDIEIAGGRAISNNGSGVLVTNADLEIWSSTIRDNVGGPGGSAAGGVGNDNSDLLLIVDSVFEGNTATGFGGALSSNHDIEIRGSNIFGNGGLGAIAGDGPVTLIDTEVHDNPSSNNAVGIGSGGVSLLRSEIYDNTNSGIGTNGPVEAIQSNISGNGGNGIGNSHSVTLISSTVHDNADSGVGTPALDMIQSTVTGNAPNVDTGDLEVIGSVMADPSSGPSCTLDDTISYGGNVSDDASCELDLDEVLATPLGLGPLQDNGGPTWSRMPSATSPLLDRIAPAGCGSIVDFPQFDADEDQRGFSRPGETEGGGCDTGAVERCTDGTFPDVSLTHQFARDICWMGVQGITTGYGDGQYKPSLPVSRQAMSAFMYRLAGSPSFSPPATPTFADVSTGNDFYLEVEWMAEEEITTGFATTPPTYKPNAPVSRQAMSAFMYRLAGSPAFSPSGQTFADVAPSNQFFLPIEWMADEGITTGFATNPPTYQPAAAVSRQAMSAFMRRLATGPGVGI